MPDPLRIEIENAAVEISPEGLQQMLAGQGADVRFSQLEFRLSAAAVQALAAQLLPSTDGTPARVEITPQGVLLEGEKEGRRVRIRLDTTGVRLVPGDGDLRLVTDDSSGG
jgi:hypothetical protein